MTRFIGYVEGGGHYVGFPVTGRITSRFGAKDMIAHRLGHTGVDIAAPEGTLLRAPAAGTVYYVESGNATFGNWCIIEHGEGEKQYSLYGHMQGPPHVNEGERVEIGDKLGRVGSTGVSTGPHVHWGHAYSDNPYHRRQGKLFDPLKHLYTPDERMGELSPEIGRVALAIKLLRQPAKVTAQGRDFNGRPRYKAGLRD